MAAPVEAGDGPRPRSRLTARVRRDVGVDQAAFRMVTSRASRPPDPAVLERVAAEVTDGLVCFERHGWLTDPASYHQDPTPLDGIRSRSVGGVGHRVDISWPDEYECRPDEPGSARFAGYTKNRIARATLLEHRHGGDRPWLVALHGFGMGSPRIDLRAFRAEHLYRDLGLNLAFLTLPFHGKRREGRPGLPSFPGVDVLDNVHGLAQAVWDARQLIEHLRERTSAPVGVMGLSLGGCVAALTASLHDVDAALLLIPLVDLGALIEDSADRFDTAGTDAELLAQAHRLHEPVSPLALSPRVPLDRRFIVSGTLDQFVRPSSHAVALWKHWDQPDLHWYHGGHVSMFWDRRARAAIDTSLTGMFDLSP